MSAVRHYIGLRKKIIDRKLVEFGIHPSLAYVLAPILFAALSLFIFYKTELGVHIYVTVAATYLFQFVDGNKLDFLKLHFDKNIFRKLLLVEHLMVMLPFVVILCIKSEFIWAAILLVVAIILSLLNARKHNGFYLPTPFGKFPYEFATGIRKLFPFYLLILFLLAMAVSVTNYNLGLFTLALVPFMCMNFYAEIENPYYVWVYKKSPREYLKHKCFVSVGYLTVLSLPIFLVLVYFFPSMLNVSLAIFVLSYLYLCSYIIFKYVRYPKQLSFIQVILLTISCLFPPLISFTLAYYLPKANLNLQQFLK